MSAKQITKVKICGIRTPDAMTAALESGADFVGLVFHPASPRYVEIEVAAYLANYVPPSVMVVGLFSNPSEKTLEETLQNVRIDMIQLHGHESPQNCAAIKARFSKPIIKALSASELDNATAFAAVCDWLIIDAPAPAGATYEGGHGNGFDWSVLKEFNPGKPWMLAGGLSPDNVEDAIRSTHPMGVDVSSGVEITKGIKDVGKIRAFIQAAKKA
jgi:phosphoribosylanthranilate isomerase